MATTEELSEYYAKLLIIQYLQKPKAYATAKAIAYPVLMDQVPIAIKNAFDPSTAVGEQLDWIGKYVGITRRGNSLSGPITLGDSDFRTLIKLVMIKNYSGSSLYEIQSLIALNFPNQITVSDNQVMGLNYVLIDSLGTSDLLEILSTGGYLPAPMGVQVSVVVVPDLTVPYYGWRTYLAADPDVAPFNSYQFPVYSNVWLSYAGVS